MRSYFFVIRKKYVKIDSCSISFIISCMLSVALPNTGTTTAPAFATKSKMLRPIKTSDVHSELSPLILIFKLRDNYFNRNYLF